MNVKKIYYRNSLLYKYELELVFLFDQKEYVLVFHNSDFFLVSIGATFSMTGFEEWDLQKFGIEGENGSLVVKEIRRTINYDAFYILFNNDYVMKIAEYPDNYLGEIVQGVQTFSNINELNRKAGEDLNELKIIEIVDFRYSLDKTKLF